MKEKCLCEICGEPMPENEQMFKYHGYSSKYPKPPLKKTYSNNTEFKGTKGKWEAIGFECVDFSNLIVGVKNGKPAGICKIFYDGIKIPDEAKANAKLIAAAPDLLEACQKVISGGYGCAPSVEFMDNLKKICESAIKKATE